MPAVLFWLAMLAVLTSVRLLVAGLSPLSPDEAYYWTWSHALAPGYLDHPPMTALWIRLGTLLCGDTRLGVRLLSPLAAALGTLLLASACNDLRGAAKPTPTGWDAPLAAAVLLNATLLLGVGAVTITPDTPLLFFWTACLAALGRLLATGRRLWWLAVGVCLGLALDSKYTAVLPGAGLAFWLLASRDARRWLRTPWPWAAALTALALFAPVIWWNAAHGWASFIKQGGRTGDWHPAEATRYLGELLGGQAGLATPLILILFVVGMARLARHPISAPAGETLLVWVTLPAALVFVQHAFGARVQANWPGLLYPACAIAASTRPTLARPILARWTKPAAGLGFVLTALVYLQSVAAPFPLPRKLDITLVRLAGWRTLATQLADRDHFIIADDYGVAAELAFALPHRAVLAAAPRWRLFALPHPDLAAPSLGGESGLLLRSARRKGGPDPSLFSATQLLGTIERRRGNVLAERYNIYRVTIRTGLPAELRDEIVRLPTPTR